MANFLLNRQLSRDGLRQTLEQRGISRREFLQFCGEMGLLLGVGAAAGPVIAQSLERQRRPSVIWLELQECTGCPEAVLRTADPTIGDLILEMVSLDYMHLIMAAAGHQAEAVLRQAIEDNYGNYLLAVTGSVPMAEDGIYTTLGGRTALEVLEEGAAGAKAILAVGACAHYGSVQSASPNPTDAKGVDEIITDKPIVNIAGCPPIPDTITATIVHFLAFNQLPEVDAQKRPLFAYGGLIHDQCERRAYFDAGQFAQYFDDDAARQGWCLYNVGCKGPATFSPCPIIKWNVRTSWPVGAGHGCIGCTEAYFWDRMTPFYERLPDVAGLRVRELADVVGVGAAAGATAAVLAHGAATLVRRRRDTGAGDGGESRSGSDQE